MKKYLVAAGLTAVLSGLAVYYRDGNLDYSSTTSHQQTKTAKQEAPKDAEDQDSELYYAENKPLSNRFELLGRLDNIEARLRDEPYSKVKYDSDGWHGFSTENGFYNYRCVNLPKLSHYGRVIFCKEDIEFFVDVNEKVVYNISLIGLQNNPGYERGIKNWDDLFEKANKIFKIFSEKYRKEIQRVIEEHDSNLENKVK